MLQEDMFAWSEGKACQRRGLDLAIGARHDRDHVLAVGADQDQRRARRGISLCDERQVDAAVLQQRQRFGGKRVAADRANHPHRRAGAPRRQRLVRPLAAGCGAEACARHRLARRRKPADRRDQVEIDGADDGNQQMPPR